VIRQLRVALAILLALGSVWAAQLSAPALVRACTCAAPDPAAPVFTGQEQAVFIGTAGMPRDDGTYEFTIERWFVGGNVARANVMSERVVFQDGSTTINTCGLHFEVGDRLIMSATMDGTTLVPGLCSPHAVVNSEEGQRLLNAAVATFGQGSSPGQPGEPGQPEPGVDPVLDLPTFALLVLAVVLVVGLIVVVNARRERQDEAPS
jgi:hypothetical protein